MKVWRATVRAGGLFLWLVIAAGCGGGGGGGGSDDTAAPALTVDASSLLTNHYSQGISGTVEKGAALEFSVVPAATVTGLVISGTAWSCTVTGLSEGVSTVTVTAADAAGNEASAAIVITCDWTPPAVVVTTPQAGALDAPVRGQLAARFSEALDAATLDAASFAVTDAQGQPVPGAVSYDPPARLAVFSPATALAAGAVYTATLAATVSDPAGNGLAGGYSWEFTAAAPVTAFDEADFWLNDQSAYEPVNVLVRQAGGGSIRLDTGAAGVEHQIYSPPGAFSFRLAGDEALRLWIHVPEVAADHQLYLFLGQGGFDGYAYALLPSLDIDGWQCVTLTRSDFAVAGPFAWSLPIDSISLRLAGADLTRPNVQLYVDAIQVQGKDLPSVVFCFDDGNESDYAEAFAYLVGKRMSATSFVNSVSIGWNGYLDSEEMDEMYAAGWDFANHTANHEDLCLLAPAARLAEITAGRDWLVAHGYPRSADYLAFPYGEYAGTTAEVEQAGVVAARTVQPCPLETGSGRIDPLRYPGTIELRPSITLAEVKNAVDRAVLYGQSAIIYAHEIVPETTGNYQWVRADFRALVDYVAQQRNQGRLRVHTFRELHEMLNP